MKVFQPREPFDSKDAQNMETEAYRYGPAIADEASRSIEKTFRTELQSAYDAGFRDAMQEVLSMVEFSCEWTPGLNHLEVNTFKRDSWLSNQLVGNYMVPVKNIDRADIFDNIYCDVSWKQDMDAYQAAMNPGGTGA